MHPGVFLRCRMTQNSANARPLTSGLREACPRLVDVGGRAGPLPQRPGLPVRLAGSRPPERPHSIGLSSRARRRRWRPRSLATESSQPTGRTTSCCGHPDGYARPFELSQSGEVFPYGLIWSSLGHRPILRKPRVGPAEPHAHHCRWIPRVHQKAESERMTESHDPGQAGLRNPIIGIGAIHKHTHRANALPGDESPPP